MSPADGRGAATDVEVVHPHHTLCGAQSLLARIERSRHESNLDGHMVEVRLDDLRYVAPVLRDYVAVSARQPAPDGGAPGEVERLTRERDEAFRRHAITTREACDAATRIGELTRELEQAQLQLVTARMQRDTARLRGDRTCERATAAERALAEARAVLRRVEWSASSEGVDGRHWYECPSCGGVQPGRGKPPRWSGFGHKPGCVLAVVLAADPGPAPAADTGGDDA